jgi:hypothetical protein
MRAWLTMLAAAGFASGTLMISILNSAVFGSIGFDVHFCNSVAGRTPDVPEMYT